MQDDTGDLMRLVEAEDIDRVLALVSVEEIARAWHRYGAAPEPKDYEHPDWWAVELLMTREIFKRTALYRELLVALVAQASDELSLGGVGAGPLESFVSNNEEDLRWLEAECEANPAMRSALATTWVATHVSPDTLARLDAAARATLPRPRRGWHR